MVGLPPNTVIWREEGLGGALSFVKSVVNLGFDEAKYEKVKELLDTEITVNDAHEVAKQVLEIEHEAEEYLKDQGYMVGIIGGKPKESKTIEVTNAMRQAGELMLQTLYEHSNKSEEELKSTHMDLELQHEPNADVIRQYLLGKIEACEATYVAMERARREEVKDPS